MMVAKNKSEWFELNKPLGEPDIAKNYKEDSYLIERVVKNNGEIVWFGQGTNWISKDNGKTWSYLGTNEKIEMIPVTKNEQGEWVGGYYPEERNVWIKCDAPIYEKLYLKLK